MTGGPPTGAARAGGTPPAARATVFTTRAVAPGDRAAHWQRALSRVFADVEVSVRDAADWSASLTADRLGAVQTATEASGAATVLRGPAAVAADPRRHVLARLQLDGGARLHQDGRTARLGPGELAFLDAGRPFTLTFAQPQRALVLMVPRALLWLDERALGRITATTVAGADGGTGALLLPLLSGLAPQIAGAPAVVRERLGRSAAELLAALAADLAGRAAAGPGQSAQTLLDRIMASADARLGDPDLTPQDLADRHGISLRYLHKLFQRQGTTVNGWVRGRRLAAAHRELAEPGASRRAIAAVGARWGFTSSSHFSRSFRDAYGMSPVQWRARARSAGGGPGERA
ncbi:helix-turn-helix domain-containing protein [Kitasatospora sp. NPDC127111]|uniref:AraC-like ligand-binding domain-containing protein n=1 Tax=Kitasatospora sp. NPDC127111 TaxID=3345363 RepID=UPI0036406C59